MILLRLKLHAQYLCLSKPRVLFTVPDTCRARFYSAKGTPLSFPFAHKHALHLFRSLFPNLWTKSVSRDPRGTNSSLPLHHLIIIHLGGRISAAWDIKPITQSWQSTSPSPPALLLLSRRCQIYWKKSVLNASCTAKLLYYSGCPPDTAVAVFVCFFK